MLVPKPKGPRWPSCGVDVANHVASLIGPSTAATLLLPPILDAYQSSLAIEAAPADGPVGGDLGLLVALLLAKRLSLYSVAASTLYVSAMRSGDSESGLGARLLRLTREAVSPVSISVSAEAEISTVAAALDKAQPERQAVALPLILVALLTSAYGVSFISGGIGTAPSADGGMELELLVRNSVRAASEFVQPISNAVVCVAFCNAESQSIIGAAAAAFSSPLKGEDDEVDISSAPHQASIAALALAGVLTAMAYLPTSTSWPIRNIVNSCIAVGVARALQLPSLPAVLAALAGVTLYDGLGTLGTAALAADPVDIAISHPAATAASSALLSAVGPPPASVMETVAKSRLGGESFQPGLLCIALDGRITDALGLGDVVFPAMLAGWARRFDLCIMKRERGGESGSSRDGGGGYLAWALGGYAFGCLLLEAAPPDLGRAALLFLAPAMALGVLGRLVARGELIEAFEGWYEEDDKGR